MKKLNKICEVCGGKFHGTFKGDKDMYLCVKHLHHMNRHGKIIERTRYDKNEIINLGSNSEIVLYDRKNKITARAIIDSDCVEIVKNYKWTGTKKGESIYVKTDIRVGSKRGTLYLSSLILGQKKGFQVDHKNGNTLDNRRENLRFATQRQNLMNKSKALGYSKNKRNLWETYIGVNRKIVHLGQFKTEEEAKVVRRKAELKYYGEFAKLLDK